MVASLANSPAAWSDRATAPAPWDAVGWTRESQADRFREVLAALQPQEGESLLDYGSGTGALVDHLSEGIAYTGYDWAEGMVKRARTDHPGRSFQDWEPSGMFDLTACIGTFNLRGHKQYTWQALRRLWDKTRRRLAVSLYAGTDERCLIYTDEEVTAYAKAESFYATVTRWRHNDLLMVLTK